MTPVLLVTFLLLTVATGITSFYNKNEYKEIDDDIKNEDDDTEEFLDKNDKNDENYRNEIKPVEFINVNTPSFSKQEKVKFETDNLHVKKNDSLRQGDIQKVDREGNIISKIFFKDDKKQKGEEFYKNGSRKYQGSYKDYEREGDLVKEFYDNGVIKYEGRYRGGLRHGLGKLYAEDEESYFSGTFKYGKKNGRGKTFKNNILIEDGPYSNDLKNGFFQTFYDNGGIRFFGNYKDDKRNGKGKMFDTDGKVVFEGDFLNDNIFEGEVYKYQTRKEYEYTGCIKNGKEEDKSGSLEVLEDFTLSVKYEGRGYNRKMIGINLNKGDKVLATFEDGRAEVPVIVIKNDGKSFECYDDEKCVKVTDDIVEESDIEDEKIRFKRKYFFNGDTRNYFGNSVVNDLKNLLNNLSPKEGFDVEIYKHLEDLSSNKGVEKMIYIDSGTNQYISQQFDGENIVNTIFNCDKNGNEKDDSTSIKITSEGIFKKFIIKKQDKELRLTFIPKENRAKNPFLSYNEFDNIIEEEKKIINSYSSSSFDNEVSMLLNNKESLGVKLLSCAYKNSKDSTYMGTIATFKNETGIIFEKGEFVESEGKLELSCSNAEIISNFYHFKGKYRENDVEGELTINNRYRINEYKGEFFACGDYFKKDDKLNGKFNKDLNIIYIDKDAKIMHNSNGKCYNYIGNKLTLEEVYDNSFLGEDEKKILSLKIKKGVQEENGEVLASFAFFEDGSGRYIGNKLEENFLDFEDQDSKEQIAQGMCNIITYGALFDKICYRNSNLPKIRQQIWVDKNSLKKIYNIDNNDGDCYYNNVEYNEKGLTILQKTRCNDEGKTLYSSDYEQEISAIAYANNNMPQSAARITIDTTSAEDRSKVLFEFYKKEEEAGTLNKEVSESQILKSIKEEGQSATFKNCFEQQKQLDIKNAKIKTNGLITISKDKIQCEEILLEHFRDVKQRGIYSGIAYYNDKSNIYDFLSYNERKECAKQISEINSPDDLIDDITKLNFTCENAVVKYLNFNEGQNQTAEYEGSLHDNRMYGHGKLKNTSLGTLQVKYGIDDYVELRENETIEGDWIGNVLNPQSDCRSFSADGLTTKTFCGNIEVISKFSQENKILKTKCKDIKQNKLNFSIIFFMASSETERHVNYENIINRYKKVASLEDNERIENILVGCQQLRFSNTLEADVNQEAVRQNQRLRICRLLVFNPDSQKYNLLIYDEGGRLTNYIKNCNDKGVEIGESEHYDYDYDDNNIYLLKKVTKISKVNGAQVKDYFTLSNAQDALTVERNNIPYDCDLEQYKIIGHVTEEVDGSIKGIKYDGEHSLCKGTFSSNGMLNGKNCTKKYSCGLELKSDFIQGQPVNKCNIHFNKNAEQNNGQELSLFSRFIKQSERNTYLADILGTADIVNGSDKIKNAKITCNFTKDGFIDFNNNVVVDYQSNDNKKETVIYYRNNGSIEKLVLKYTIVNHQEEVDNITMHVFNNDQWKKTQDLTVSKESDNNKGRQLKKILKEKNKEYCLKLLSNNHIQDDVKIIQSVSRKMDYNGNYIFYNESNEESKDNGTIEIFDRAGRVLCGADGYDIDNNDFSNLTLHKIKYSKKDEDLTVNDINRYNNDETTFEIEEYKVYKYEDTASYNNLTIDYHTSDDDSENLKQFIDNELGANKKVEGKYLFSKQAEDSETVKSIKQCFDLNFKEDIVKESDKLFLDKKFKNDFFITEKDVMQKENDDEGQIQNRHYILKYRNFFTQNNLEDEKFLFKGYEDIHDDNNVSFNGDIYNSKIHYKGIASKTAFQDGGTLKSSNPDFEYKGQFQFCGAHGLAQEFKIKKEQPFTLYGYNEDTSLAKLLKFIGDNGVLNTGNVRGSPSIIFKVDVEGEAGHCNFNEGNIDTTKENIFKANDFLLKFNKDSAYVSYKDTDNSTIEVSFSNGILGKYNKKSTDNQNRITTTEISCKKPDNVGKFIDEFIQKNDQNVPNERKIFSTIRNGEEKITKQSLYCNNKGLATDEGRNILDHGGEIEFEYDNNTIKKATFKYREENPSEISEKYVIDEEIEKAYENACSKNDELTEYSKTISKLENTQFLNEKTTKINDDTTLEAFNKKSGSDDYMYAKVKKEGDYYKGEYYTYNKEGEKIEHYSGKSLLFLDDRLYQGKGILKKKITLCELNITCDVILDGTFNRGVFTQGTCTYENLGYLVEGKFNNLQLIGEQMVCLKSTHSPASVFEKDDNFDSFFKGSNSLAKLKKDVINEINKEQPYFWRMDFSCSGAKINGKELLLIKEYKTRDNQDEYCVDIVKYQFVRGTIEKNVLRVELKQHNIDNTKKLIKRFVSLSKYYECKDSNNETIFKKCCVKYFAGQGKKLEQHDQQICQRFAGINPNDQLFGDQGIEFNKLRDFVVDTVVEFPKIELRKEIVYHLDGNNRPSYTKYNNLGKCDIKITDVDIEKEETSSTSKLLLCEVDEQSYLKNLKLFGCTEGLQLSDIKKENLGNEVPTEIKAYGTIREYNLSESQENAINDVMLRDVTHSSSSRDIQGLKIKENDVEITKIMKNNNGVLEGYNLDTEEKIFYVGTFKYKKDGKVCIDGEKCEIFYENSFYQGETSEGKEHGLGKKTYKKDNVYEGNFFTGRHRGSGRITVGHNQGCDICVTSDDSNKCKAFLNFLTNNELTKNYVEKKDDQNSLNCFCLKKGCTINATFSEDFTIDVSQKITLQLPDNIAVTYNNGECTLLQLDNDRKVKEISKYKNDKLLFKYSVGNNGREVNTLSSEDQKNIKDGIPSGTIIDFKIENILKAVPFDKCSQVYKNTLVGDIITRRGKDAYDQTGYVNTHYNNANDTKTNTVTTFFCNQDYKPCDSNDLLVSLTEKYTKEDNAGKLNIILKTNNEQYAYIYDDISQDLEQSQLTAPAHTQQVQPQASVAQESTSVIEKYYNLEYYKNKIKDVKNITVGIDYGKFKLLAKRCKDDSNNIAGFCFKTTDSDEVFFDHEICNSKSTLKHIKYYDYKGTYNNDDIDPMKFNGTEQGKREIILLQKTKVGELELDIGKVLTTHECKFNENMQAHDDNGTEKTCDGRLYKGSFKDDCRCGEGTITYLDSDVLLLGIPIVKYDEAGSGRYMCKDSTVTLKFKDNSYVKGDNQKITITSKYFENNPQYNYQDNNCWYTETIDEQKTVENGSEEISYISERKVYYSDEGGNRTEKIKRYIKGFEDEITEEKLYDINERITLHKKQIASKQYDTVEFTAIGPNKEDIKVKSAFYKCDYNGNPTNTSSQKFDYIYDDNSHEINKLSLITYCETEEGIVNNNAGDNVENEEQEINLENINIDTEQRQITVNKVRTQVFKPDAQKDSNGYLTDTERLDKDILTNIEQDIQKTKKDKVILTGDYIQEGEIIKGKKIEKKIIYKGKFEDDGKGGYVLNDDNGEINFELYKYKGNVKSDKPIGVGSYNFDIRQVNNIVPANVVQQQVPIAQQQLQIKDKDNGAVKFDVTGFTMVKGNWTDNLTFDISKRLIMEKHKFKRFVKNDTSIEVNFNEGGKIVNLYIKDVKTNRTKSYFEFADEGLKVEDIKSILGAGNDDIDLQQGAVFIKKKATLKESGKYDIIEYNCHSRACKKIFNAKDEKGQNCEKVLEAIYVPENSDKPKFIFVKNAADILTEVYKLNSSLNLDLESIDNNAALNMMSSICLQATQINTEEIDINNYRNLLKKYTFKGLEENEDCKLEGDFVFDETNSEFLINGNDCKKTYKKYNIIYEGEFKQGKEDGSGKLHTLVKDASTNTEVNENLDMTVPLAGFNLGL